MTKKLTSEEKEKRKQNRKQEREEVEHVAVEIGKFFYESLDGILTHFAECDICRPRVLARLQNLVDIIRHRLE